MKEGCLSVQMSKLPSVEDGARDDGADRVHAGNCGEGLVVINVLLLSISLNHKTSFQPIVGLDLEDPFTPNDALSGRDIFTANLFPSFMVDQRLEFSMYRSPPLRRVRACGGLDERRRRHDVIG